MDFSSLRRKHRLTPHRRTKTTSSSNLSRISYNPSSVSRKTVRVTLPKDLCGCDVNLEGKVVHLRRGSPAHSSGVIQVGDYIRIADDAPLKSAETDTIQLEVTFGVLQVDSRPNCPLVVEVGNRHTTLGLALTDSPPKGIQISSIQPGSLADRCGFLHPGDFLTSIYTSSGEDETQIIPCCYYNSFQIAQILRQLTASANSLKMTISPSSSFSPAVVHQVQCHNSTEDDAHSGGSDSTLTLGGGDSDNNSSGSSSHVGVALNNLPSTFSGGITLRALHHNGTVNGRSKRHIEKVDEIEEETSFTNNTCVLSFCLWKDPLYEDWGFSLVDEEEENGQNDAAKKLLQGKTDNNGAMVFQIRPGGPASVAGLLSGDRILEINGRDVAQLESTIVVPILASLEDVLSVTVLRG